MSAMARADPFLGADFEKDDEMARLMNVGFNAGHLIPFL